MDGRVSVILVGHVTLARRCDTVRRCDSRGRGGCRGLGETLDNPPHTHTRAGTMRLGQKEVNHPSMGLGWHARIGASLGTKGPRGSGVVQGVPWATMRDGSQ